MLISYFLFAENFVCRSYSRSAKQQISYGKLLFVLSIGRDISNFIWGSSSETSAAYQPPAISKKNLYGMIKFEILMIRLLAFINLKNMI